MKKCLCDLCEGDLNIITNSPDFMAAWFKRFKVIETNYFKFLLSFPYFSPYTHTEMEVCSKCFEDFKEFVQRKKSYVRK